MILPGQVFGELTTIRIRVLPRSIFGWECKCSCGNTKVIREGHLKAGRSESCGLCNHKEKHPYAHKSWDSMKQRCNNPNSPDYARYGGRGIYVCAAWNLKFMNFFRDMGDPPTCSITGNRYTLGRKDNDEHYHKDNCEWQPSKEQNWNKSNTLHEGIFRYSNGNRRNRS